MRNILKKNCTEFGALLLVSVLRTFAKTSVLWDCSFFWKGQLPHFCWLYLQRAKRGFAVPLMDRGWWQILLFHKFPHSSWCLLSESIRSKCLCCRGREGGVGPAVPQGAGHRVPQHRGWGGWCLRRLWGQHSSSHRQRAGKHEGWLLGARAESSVI